MPRKRISTEESVLSLKKVHGDKYDYSKVNYTGWDKYIIVGCFLHWDFNVMYHNHLRGQGCPECGKISFHKKMSKTTKQFILDAISVHGEKYDYSRTEYISKRQKVIIGCPKHGYFEQLPSNHLAGRGCSKCAYEEKSLKMTIDTEEFIRRSMLVHGNKYDYSKVDYKGNGKKF